MKLSNARYLLLIAALATLVAAGIGCHEMLPPAYALAAICALGILFVGLIWGRNIWTLWMIDDIEYSLAYELECHLEAARKFKIVSEKLADFGSDIPTSSSCVTVAVIYFRCSAPFRILSRQSALAFRNCVRCSQTFSNFGKARLPIFVCLSRSIRTPLYKYRGYLTYNERSKCWRLHVIRHDVIMKKSKISK